MPTILKLISLCQPHARPVAHHSNTDPVHYPPPTTTNLKGDPNRLFLIWDAPLTEIRCISNKTWSMWVVGKAQDGSVPFPKMGALTKLALFEQRVVSIWVDQFFLGGGYFPL